ncbi:hypothetical protein MTBPR1_80186 [Candidatus Terasakiella magnetica]|uniref:Uncharacterized protein n=1 Tax=Candidatus Terasakiella magnetica TaxID=1867952 RepID=A0A1C3RLF4_9PROT|nr:hypothetical protein [Candidatus Terasakiella magnetica]SCA58132.1 hypothetical protein MTBPR1_80186 [Candidatus Terasakiella magnetica]
MSNDEGISFEDFDAYLRDEAPPHDPSTGEIEEINEPVSEAEKTNKHLQQINSSIHAVVVATRDLEASKAKEETVQRVGTDVMNAQQIAKENKEKIAEVQILTKENTSHLKSIKDEMGGRDLEDLKASLETTIRNLNKAAEARINGKPSTRKWLLYGSLTYFILTLVVGVYLAISMNPILTPEVMSALDKCYTAVQRDNRAYSCKVTIRPDTNRK